MNKKPCRCLLLEAGEEELAKNISEYIKTLPPEIKADEKIYAKRLEICRKCSALSSGMCGKCGCYIEMRAAVQTNRCPSEERLW